MRWPVAYVTHLSRTSGCSAEDKLGAGAVGVEAGRSVVRMLVWLRVVRINNILDRIF